MLNVAGLNTGLIMGHAFRTGARGLSRRQAQLDPYYRVEPFRSVVYYESQAEKHSSQVKSRDRIVKEIQDGAAMFDIHAGTPERGAH
jgi:hypothetical protein